MENKRKKILGVIGGLGPMATARFIELVTDMTDAETDQQHLDMIIYSCPSIPDRTGYILDKSRPNPLPPILETGNKLVKQGAGCIAIACITAHCFYDIISENIPVPVINPIGEAALYLNKRGIAKAGIMATDGTLKAELFQREFSKLGIETVRPTPERQADLMSIIYGSIKAGKPADMGLFDRVSAELRQNGAEIIILGCTELSLINRSREIGLGYLDTMELLAEKSIVSCGGSLKKEVYD